jgi:GAF domain-containing protein/HAMP domain-containing protein
MLLHIRWGKLRTKMLLWVFTPAVLFLIGAALVVIFSMDEVSHRGLVTLLLVLSLAAPMGVVAVGASRLVEPILELTRAAQEVASGNFGLTVAAETGDEIEVLVKQFNQMSQELKTAYTNLEDMIASQACSLEMLNAIASVMSNTPDSQKALQAALEETLARLEMQAGTIRLVKDGQLEVVVQHGFSPEAVSAIRSIGLQEGLAGQAIIQGKPVVQDFEEYSRLATERQVSVMRNEKAETLISIPLLSKGQALGAMNLMASAKHSFTPQDMALLLSIGQQIGVGVENARLYEQARRELAQREQIDQNLRQANLEIARRNRELTLLNRVITATTSDMQPREILGVVCCELVNAFEAQQAAAALMDASGASLTVIAECKHEEGLSALGVIIPVQENPATLYVLKHKKPLAAPDVQSDVLFAPVRSLMKERKVVSLIILPVLKNGEVIGTIGVDWWEPHEFSDQEIALAAQVSAVAAKALERAGQ